LSDASYTSTKGKNLVFSSLLSVCFSVMTTDQTD
jgi:hypothetical protein